jgi:CheY-like chemotaxis protein
MKNSRTLLWVDDDGAERFPYEIDCLAGIGWKTVWAKNAAAAAEFLAAGRCDLVLLDQVFPFHDGDSYKDVWSGCRLLYWLRGEGAPAGAPQKDDWLELARGSRPFEENIGVPVIIISAFQDDHVDEALSAITPGTVILPKPVDESILLQHVKELNHKGP